MNFYLASFFRAWIFTVVVETLVLLVIFVKFIKKEPVDPKLVIVGSVFANSLTLPYVWFIFPSLLIGQYSLSLILSELFAWLAEAVFYKFFLKLSLKNALIASFLANLISFGLGYWVSNLKILG